MKMTLQNLTFWVAAINMWRQNKSKQEIANAYGYKVQALAKRIRDSKKNPETKGWFPKRDYLCNIVNPADDIYLGGIKREEMSKYL